MITEKLEQMLAKIQKKKTILLSKLTLFMTKNIKVGMLKAKKETLNLSS